MYEAPDLFEGSESSVSRGSFVDGNSCGAGYRTSGHVEDMSFEFKFCCDNAAHAKQPALLPQ